LLRDGSFCPASLLRTLSLTTCTLCLLTACSAQTEDKFYARKNSFGVLSAYSPDSGHLLMGVSQNRKLVDIGLSYSRRLYLNDVMNWQFDSEILPMALNSDPVQVTTTAITLTNPPTTLTSTLSQPTITSCHPGSGSGSFGPNGPTYTYVSSCTRRWVMGEGLSPIGMQWDFLPARRLQPLVEGHIGYMYSTQPIPTAYAGAFNFTFDVGAGFELYRTHSHSYRIEYRYHHISNDETADDNPGIDNGVIQVSWLFGR
jgi:Lipid A 3-O-deacylase (PagL)